MTMTAGPIPPTWPHAWRSRVARSTSLPCTGRRTSISPEPGRSTNGPATKSHYYLMSLPAALPTIFLGRFFNRRMRGNSFLAYVHGGSVCVGMVLMIQAILKA